MENIFKIQQFAKNIRKETLKLLLHKGSGFIGESMSIVETLAVLYSKNSEEDFFILSKFHASSALYATLGLKGAFSLDYLYNETLLPSYSEANLIPKIDTSIVTLEHGIATSIGIALGLKKENSSRKVYCLTDEIELEKEHYWEALQLATHFSLNNFNIFIDNSNYLLNQNLNLSEKLKKFGFHIIISKGNSIEEILKAYNEDSEGKPKAIILETTKGHGTKNFISTDSSSDSEFDDNLKGILLWEIQNFDNSEDNN